MGKWMSKHEKEVRIEEIRAERDKQLSKDKVYITKTTAGKDKTVAVTTMIKDITVAVVGNDGKK